MYQTGQACYYRVSIKSFPDYKRLFQENYVEYKHIFFLPLLKVVSKILHHVFIVMLQLHNLLVSKWRQRRRKPSVFCSITKQNHWLRCSGNSEIFRNECGRPPPDVQSIKARYSKFVETGSVGDCNRSDRPRHVGERVERI